MKKLIFSSNSISLITIILFSFLALLSLLQNGIPLTHDGQDHLARIANFYASLSEGILVPRWAGNLNWGYGHPVMMFLYPLPSYMASLFHFLGFDISNSFKLVFAFSFIASAFSMYYWLRTFTGIYPALLGSVLYIYLPYRFVDMYVRGAIGEHVAFIFPPLICYFLVKSSLKGNLWNFTGIILSSAGLILAHNAISIMFFPIIIFYGLLDYIKHKNLLVAIKQIGSIGYGVLLSAFFWIPAFLEGKYTLRDIVTGSDEYSHRYIDLKSLLYGDWNYGITGQFSTQIGLVGLAVLALGLFFLFKKYSAHRKSLFFWYAVFVVSIFVMLPISKPIYEIFTILQKFQFPWRFLSVTVFSVSVISAIVFSYLSKNNQKIIVPIFLAVLLLISLPYMKAKGYLEKEDTFYSGIYSGTTDTGESAPIWSVRFMEKRPGRVAEFIDGYGRIFPQTRKTTIHTYEVQATTSSKILENTLYFPGWNVYVDGKKAPIEFQDQNHRGLITFPLSSGNHKIDIIFKDTKVRLIANLISTICLLLLILLFVPKFIKVFTKKS
ncbi:MAG: hypothetical protein KA477_02080 [Candidatus Levybacteria bacterium]|nr:hypothetical protein [Candidatus Levybacteria bacterium]